MVDKWFSWDTKDVFKRTQLRLTVFYSIILTIFLIVFAAIVLFILFQVIIGDEERKINELADHEMSELQQTLQRQRGQKFRQENQTVFLTENQLFYYVTNKEGELVIANETISPLRALFLERISDWESRKNEIKQASINVPTNSDEYRQFRDFNMRVLMLGRPIKANGDIVGMMYIGLDISYINTIFKWVVIVLFALAIIFIGVAIWLSYIMSRKALIPIETAYNQQREFVANASHELRTPLSVIFSSIEALELEEKEQDAFTQKIMKGLKLEVKRMTKLINDLLTLARLDSEQEKAELSKQWFDFLPESRYVVQSFNGLASEKQIKLTYDTDEPLWIFADRDKLIQLLYILIDNAIKYTNSGGEILVHFSIIQYKQEGSLRIAVSDTGVGMSEEDILRIFDRFYRANKARTRKEGGYGLGLSIAKWIVDAHKGRIQVKSELGIGTKFEVDIPFKIKD